MKIHRSAIFLFLAGILFTNFSIAQSKVDVDISDKIRDTHFSLITDAVSIENNGLLVLRSTSNLIKREFKVQTFDQDLKLVNSVSMKANYGYVPYKLISLEGQVYLLSRTVRKKDTRSFVWTAQPVSTDPLKISNRHFQIAKIENVQVNTRWFGGSRDAYSNSGLEPEIEYSPDSTKAGVLFRVNNVRWRDRIVYQVSVFDKNLQKLVNKSIELPYREREYEIEDFFVGNKGDVYVCASMREERGFTRRIRHVDVWKLSPEREILNYTYEIKSEKNQIAGISFVTEDDMSIKLAAFIEAKNTFLEEIFLLDLDENLKLRSSKTEKITFDDFVNSATIDQPKQRKDRARSQKDVIVRKSFPLEDGSMVLLAEQFEIHRRTVNDGLPSSGMTMTDTEYEYRYGNILVFKISKEFSLEWARIVPKRQRSTDDGGFYWGFAPIDVGDELYLYYNDDIKNLDKKRKRTNPASMADRKNLVLMQAKIDLTNGKMRRKSMFRLKEKQTYPVPQKHFEVHDNELIILAKRNKDKRVVRISFYDESTAAKSD